jgi:16S rRNA (guanine966-N2)-methyltransferase
VIGSNLDGTGLRGESRVACADVARYLARTPRARFDIAFLDPPYGRGLGFLARVLMLLANRAWMHPDGTVVVEAEVGPVDWPTGFRETRTRKFGRTQVSMAVVHDERANGHLSRDF